MAHGEPGNGMDSAFFPESPANCPFEEGVKVQNGAPNNNTKKQQNTLGMPTFSDQEWLWNGIHFPSLDNDNPTPQ